jgi:hypothetical protein
MNRRITTLWLPGLLSLTVAMGLLMVMRRVGVPPHIVWVRRMPMLIFMPWLVALPLSGAASAYLSSRGGGNVAACLLASLFPAIVLFCLVSIGFAGMAISDRLDRPEWLYVGLGFFNWVILPGVALLVGAMPFLGARGN